MTTVLNIAGHGLKPDGSFDPGAKGLIAKGEHNYMAEDFFPAMKRHIPKDSKLKFEFYTKRNVLHYGDIVSLANSYGKDTIVIEYHYDAFTATAKGGHVIIWHKFKPDSLDLRLRDAIGSMVGLRFEHMGQKGISGRDNLGNARMTANSGVNYRLLELGFGTNKENAKVMTENIDEYAKKLVEAILDTEVDDQPKTENKPVEVVKPVEKPAVTSSPESVQDWMNANKDKWGDGSYANRKVVATKYAGISNYSGTAEQNVQLLNFVKNNSPKPAASAESVAQDIAHGRGDWGNNPERANKLKAAGYDANAIQNRVNEILSGTPKTATTSSTIKVGDKVTASRLYGSGADTTADRTSSIAGYVDKINNSWKNPYRLVKTKGKTDYLGFTRKEHLSK